MNEYDIIAHKLNNIYVSDNTRRAQIAHCMMMRRVKDT